MKTCFERFTVAQKDSRNQNIEPQYRADEAAWIWLPGFTSPEQDSMADFLLDFELTEDLSTECYISADSRYVFYCDGERVGMGPDRCDQEHWSFAAYRVTLPAGKHSFRVRAWYFSKNVPFSQLSLRPGFMFCGAKEYDGLFTTGTAPWRVREVRGFQQLPFSWLAGGETTQDLSEDKTLPETVPVIVRSPLEVNGFGVPAEGWKLCPTPLPEQIYRKYSGKIRVRAIVEGETQKNTLIEEKHSKSAEIPFWENYINGSGTIEIPPGRKVHILCDFETYVCVYSELKLSGGCGGSVSFAWQESLQLKPDDFQHKGNRNEIIGKYFMRFNHIDSFVNTDGGKHHCIPLWWRPGRYLLMSIDSGTTPMTLEAPAFMESRYPLEQESSITFDELDLQRIQPMLLLTQQMCSHEMLMDCPFYEQQLYVADSRLENLAGFAYMHDSDLAMRVVQIFDWSRMIWGGFAGENWPTQMKQLSGTYAMLWPLQIADYTMYRRYEDDRTFLKLRSAARSSVIAVSEYVNEEGLIENLPGWSFVDWVSIWGNGMPKSVGTHGKSALYTLHFLLMLQTMIRLEKMYLPEPGFGITEYCRNLFSRSAEALRKTFWVEEKSLFAEDPAHTEYSMHSQCFALLADVLTGEEAEKCYRAMLEETNIAFPTLYFIFYLFEVMQKFGEGYRILEHTHIWTDMLDNGAVTAWETPEPSRSDCHAWNTHPYYHYFSTLAGIRPASAGFRTVKIEPSFGRLNHAAGKMPHPDGWIEFELNKAADGAVHGTVTLPEGCTGTYHNAGKVLSLVSGLNPV